jgi:spore maturation protein CgeB
MFEAAFSKTLMFVKKDPWNIIEYFFTSNKDFLYFKKEKDLPKLINRILKNYDLYKPMVNSTFKKAKKNYTVKAFYKKYLLKYELKNNRNYDD